jgi:hypothetical protein
MADETIPDAVRLLLARHLPTVDHVAVLVILYAMPQRVHEAKELAAEARLSESVATAVLADLTGGHLVKRDGSGFLYDPDARNRAAVEQLAELYNSRPVSLMRAIYDRPASTARSFADAFRIRKEEE